ncbi:precorrin-6A synthase (deacetylating) [uncultured Thiohalocapsa sp.]|uniref:precorrin-6A synthase (deacetylating) n=1 Tax=uncultured Thiohalocapsa sp. TaxID=768990 RepID=UPI0025CC10A4|nr:precorrin-6A synthase (deacetylating) [uncultured Thiohalocapsa sp.]
MKHCMLIGIGPGHPDFLTLQAMAAMRRVDVFFLLEKAGRGKDELLALRRDIMRRVRPDGGYREVRVPSPPRPRAVDLDGAAYRAIVADWHAEKRRIFAELLTRELGDGETAGLLLWGDPLLYDQTISMVEAVVRTLPEPVQVGVIAGISAVQVLAARHRIPLNRVGESVQIITGREAETVDPAQVHNVIVMLDYNASFRRFVGQDMEIYWGGYLGGDDEVLVAGALDEVLEELLRVKARLRAHKGWLMDTYLLRRRVQGAD